MRIRVPLSTPLLLAFALIAALSSLAAVPPAGAAAERSFPYDAGAFPFRAEGATRAAWKGPVYAPDELLVRFRSGSTALDRARAIGEERATQLGETTGDGLVKVRLPAGETAVGAIGRWSARADVEYAAVNLRAHAFFVPNDTVIGIVDWAWNLRNVHAYDAWDIQTGSPRVLLAIIDSGVAYENHYIPDYERPILWPGTRMYRRSPELRGRMVHGWDFVHDDAHANDDYGHGTMVATIAAGAANNVAGSAGIAFGIGIMPIKVLDWRGDSDMSLIVAGIRFAADHGARIANLSLGFPPLSYYRDVLQLPDSLIQAAFRPLKEAVDHAQRRGVILVAAAGNFDASEVSLPAGYPGVIAVGATGFDNLRTSYSSYGSNLDFMAPGGDFTEMNGDGIQDAVFELSIKPNRSEGSLAKPDSFGVFPFFGTSAASPHVAGAVALLLSKGYTTQESIEKVLRRTSIVPVGDPHVFNPEYGYGLIQLDAALRQRLPRRWDRDHDDRGDRAPSAAARLASPNPGRGEATLAFEIPREGRVTVRVFDVRGGLVRTVEDRVLGAGSSLARWDGRRADGTRVPAGIYFFRLDTPEGTQTHKFALVR